MKNTLFAFLLLCAFSCSNEKPTENIQAPPQNDVNIVASDSIRKPFVLPDSINANLIIATYVEIDPESHTLLIYTNNDKKKATLIRYLNDGCVSTDPLEVVSENILRSTLSKSTYEINDSMVVFKMPNGHLEDHFRTDANN